MAAPSARLRQDLSAPGLLQSVRRCFATIADHRRGAEISLADALMSGLAVFSLKYPSLLKFDQARQDEASLRHNLRTLYGVERAPCDTQLRRIADGVDPALLRPAFKAVHHHLQRGNALVYYRYLEGHYIVSVDGTGQYSSSAISCPECCEKRSGGKTRYHHQLLAAVMVHPERKTVLPLMPEPITRQDGRTKNDCERNAAKRLLSALREDFPQQKLIIVEDSLASNGPHIEHQQALNLRYILAAKPGDHKALFETVQQRLMAGQCHEQTHTDECGVEQGYRWTDNVALNKSHPNL